MTNYQGLGETIHRDWRPAGSPTWLDLSFTERAFWHDVAKAADGVLTAPEPDEFWCPDCDDYRGEIEKLEVDIERLEDQLERAKQP